MKHAVKWVAGEGAIYVFIRDGRRLVKKRFTLREWDVAKLIVCGDSNTEIANKLGLSVVTVKKHIGIIFLKLDVQNRVQAAVFLSRILPSS